MKTTLVHSYGKNYVLRGEWAPKSIAKWLERGKPRPRYSCYLMFIRRVVEGTADLDGSNTVSLGTWQFDLSQLN